MKLMLNDPFTGATTLTIVLLTSAVGVTSFSSSGFQVGNRHRLLSESATSTIADIVLRSSAVEDAARFSTFADSLDSDLNGVESSGVTTLMSSSTKKSYETPNESSKSLSWQSKLDRLVDPSTNLADRQILLSELINSNSEIRDSVFDALTTRKLDPLLTPNQKKLQDGTRAVVRQLTNDILPQIDVTSFQRRSTSSAQQRQTPSLVFPPPPPNIEKIGTRLFSAVTNQIQKNIEELQDDLTDPMNKIPKRLEKQRDEVLQEARNVFLEKPEGLEEPPYTVLQTTDLYEIRSYESYTVASTRSSSSEEEGSDNDDGNTDEQFQMAGSGSAFNKLASYIFGENDESKVMSMTTPVTTTSSGDMRFYIKTDDGDAIPYPKNSSNEKRKIEIVRIPSSTLAVRKFPGFVTDGEVSRQKGTLLQAIVMDSESTGVELDVPHGAVVPHVVFQYNPPYTLPIVRCNEIGVPVRIIKSSSDSEAVGGDGSRDASSSDKFLNVPTKSSDLRKEWTIEDDDDDLVKVMKP